MVKSVPTSRPVDALRMSADQIRRAREILAEIADDTAGPTSRLQVFPEGAPPTASDREFERQATILSAQRSFAAGLRLSQPESDPSP